MKRKTFSKLCFVLSLTLFALSLKAQTNNKRYNKEVISLMNYVRDSTLKIATWATRPYFKRIDWSDFFVSSKFWKSATNNLFNDKEISFIAKQIKDTTRYMLTEEMIRVAYRKPETLSYNLYQLSVEKFFIEYYTREKVRVNENLINEVDVDTAKYGKIDNSKYGNYSKVIAQHFSAYNQSIRDIQDYRKRLQYAYEYHFAKPIFIKNYKYCILIYSYGDDGFNGSGTLQMFKKQKGKWTFYKTLVKRFSTGHDVY